LGFGLGFGKPPLITTLADNVFTLVYFHSFCFKVVDSRFQDWQLLIFSGGFLVMYIFALFFGWGKRQLQQSTHIKNSIKKMSVAKLHYAFYIFEPHTHTHTQKTKTKPIF